MSAEALRALVREVDVEDQKAARVALGLMVMQGGIHESKLDLVVTTRRNHRKSLSRVTVADLIDMGIVAVVPSD